jgi:hypothetical protein
VRGPQREVVRLIDRAGTVRVEEPVLDDLIVVRDFADVWIESAAGPRWTRER